MRLTRNEDVLPLFTPNTPNKAVRPSSRRMYIRACNWFRTRSQTMKLFVLLIPIFIIFILFRMVKNEPDIPPTKEFIERIRPLEKLDPKRRTADDTHVDESIVESKISASKMKFQGPTNERQRAVVKAFQHSWDGYRLYAMGHDNLKPVSKGYSDWFDTGLTIIDGIDTAIIMGLEKEAAEMTKWIKEELSFEKDRMVNFFECTIRALGGLLSAYHLTDDQVFLEKALDVGGRLIAAFKSSSPVPYSDVNLKKRTGSNPQWGAESSLAEATTVQLEFRDLSRASGNSTFEELAFNTSKHIHKIGCEEHSGLCGMFISANTGQFKKGSTITFGARADSYYEYLYKQWLQTGKTIDWLKDDFQKAMDSMDSQLWRHSEPNSLFFVGELLSGETYSPKMDHLVCFLAGTLSHSSQNGLPEKYLHMAEKLGETCHEMYNNPTGLGPEIAHFNMIPGKEDLYIKPLDAHCLLRPEAIEGWFYLYRATGDKKYQEYGWSAFQAIEKYAKIPTGGYSSIANVKRTVVSHRDMMESFFLSETLKYLYLLLADDQEILPLDQWVFNTEGHPLPIYDH